MAKPTSKIYAAEAYVRVHETTLRGFLSSTGVANYLGLKYAEIPERFRNAKAISLEHLSGTIDATEYGPRCPQPRNGGRERRLHLYEGIQPASLLPDSEFDCLSLNIYAPPNTPKSSRKLPVVVWIHGGGLIFGDGGSEYDGNDLIQQSIALQKPFIFVTMNYRLGYYGFLSSQELEAEALSLGEDYCPNQGLRDQRLALEWVQANIQFFSGDSSNVTVAGQSAGGWAALCHLVTNKPLCHRGWIMSSTLSPFAEAGEPQSTFDQLVAGTGLAASTSDSTKLDALRNLTDEQMARLVANLMLIRPVWDSNWFVFQDQATPFACINRFPGWIRGLTIGWVKDEFANFHNIWKSWSTEQIREVITSTISDREFAEDILQAYTISKDCQDDALKGLVDFTTDSFYAALPITLAELGVPTSVYRFDQTDTFEQSIYKGYAYHCLDTTMLCRLPAVAGPEAPNSMRATADAMSHSLNAFVYGNQPWEPFKSNGKVMLFNSDQTGLVDWPSDARWKPFMATNEKAIMFARAGCALLPYMARIFSSQGYSKLR